MAPRRAYSEDESDYDDCSPKKKAKRSNLKSSKPPKVSTKAKITILATDITPSKTDARERLEKIDDEVLGRIKKALALASHDGTGETEAKAALRMASKLMARYSVTQADILSQESDAEKLQRAGTSVVSIRSAKNLGTMVRLETWASILGDAMCEFFDCQVYTTTFGTKVEFSFYGLSEQTVAAAYAMEMAYNLILSWSMTNGSKGLHQKNAYKTGVAEGLERLAQDEKASEKQKALVHEQKLLGQKRKEEEAEDQSRLERLQNPIVTDEQEQKPKDTKVKLEEVEDEDQPNLGSFTQSSSSSGLETSQPKDEDADDGFRATGDIFASADFVDSDDENDVPFDAPHSQSDSDDDAGSSTPPSMLPPPVPQFKKEEDETQWGSVNQLVAFRETSVAVGDEYLKSQGIELSKGRSTRPVEFKDWEAKEMYYQGVRDAKKIDVRGRRLMGAEQD